jgi:hypothetical protein
MELRLRVQKLNILGLCCFCNSDGHWRDCQIYQGGEQAVFLDRDFENLSDCLDT